MTFYTINSNYHTCLEQPILHRQLIDIEAGLRQKNLLTRERCPCLLFKNTHIKLLVYQSIMQKVQHELAPHISYLNIIMCIVTTAILFITWLFKPFRLGIESIDKVKHLYIQLLCLLYSANSLWNPNVPSSRSSRNTAFLLTFLLSASNSKHSLHPRTEPCYARLWWKHGGGGVSVDEEYQYLKIYPL